MVKQNAVWLLKHGHVLQIPSLVVNSGCKYLGYLAGKRYRKLPMALVRRCSMNKSYWDRQPEAAGAASGKDHRKEQTGV